MPKHYLQLKKVKKEEIIQPTLLVLSYPICSLFTAQNSAIQETMTHFTSVEVENTALIITFLRISAERNKLWPTRLALCNVFRDLLRDKNHELCKDLHIFDGYLLKNI